MLAVGLMSGTSADGVTAALVELGRGFKVLSFRTFPYAPALRRRVLAAADLKAAGLSRLNMELGEVFARAALAVAKGETVAVIGSHGQTVWHGPDADIPNTLQIAEPSVIAERTGVPVVADFRPRDMAAGGQGAPLIPAFDAFLYGSGPLVALQNIGGIGNVSVAGRGGLWTAFDTGPGNCLMDLAVSLATGGRRAMDFNGRLAARGKADGKLAARLLGSSYFLKPPPKSLDRRTFGGGYLARHFGRIGPRTPRQALCDALATLALLTARSIEDSYRRFVLPRHKVSRVIVSGGGSRNPVLMRLLAGLLAPIPVSTTPPGGVPAMAKEAACFAWMAARAIQGKPNNCPAATGAAGPRVLGKIIPACRLLAGLILALSAAGQGCATVAVAGASQGINYTVTNVAYRTFTAPMERVRTATVKALKTMKIDCAKDCVEKKPDGWRFKAKANELDIIVRISSVTANATKVAVDARKNYFIKDKPVAFEVINQVGLAMGLK